MFSTSSLRVTGYLCWNRYLQPFDSAFAWHASGCGCSGDCVRWLLDYIRMDRPAVWFGKVRTGHWHGVCLDLPPSRALQG